MSDTPRTDKLARGNHVVPTEWVEELERECNQLREALQLVMDWNPKPEYWERPETVVRFEADMAKARELLERLTNHKLAQH